jgi:hypothetical protein
MEACECVPTFPINGSMHRNPVPVLALESVLPLDGSRYSSTVAGNTCIYQYSKTENSVFPVRRCYSLQRTYRYPKSLDDLALLRRMMSRTLKMFNYHLRTHTRHYEVSSLSVARNRNDGLFSAFCIVALSSLPLLLLFFISFNFNLYLLIKDPRCWTCSCRCGDCG